MVKAWTADCWYMWAEGKIFVKCYYKILCRFCCVNFDTGKVERKRREVHAPLSRSVCWPAGLYVKKNNLFMSTQCLPHHSLPGHWDQTNESLCQSLGSRSTQTRGLFTLGPLSFVTTSCLSVCSVTSTVIFRKHVKMHIFDWAFLYRDQHAQWPFDATEQLNRFCCWIPIRLSSL